MIVFDTFERLIFFFLYLTGLLNFARPRLSTAWKYARVEMRPPGPSEWGAAAAEAANAVSTISTGKFLQWTVRVSDYYLLHKYDY